MSLVEMQTTAVLRIAMRSSLTIGMVGAAMLASARSKMQMGQARTGKAVTTSTLLLSNSPCN